MSLFCTPSIQSSLYLSLWGSYYSPHLQMKKLRIISRLTTFSWATFSKERGWDLNSDLSHCQSSHAQPKVMLWESWLKTKHSHLHWIPKMLPSALSRKEISLWREQLRIPYCAQHIWCSVNKTFVASPQTWKSSDNRFISYHKKVTLSPIIREVQVRAL